MKHKSHSRNAVRFTLGIAVLTLGFGMAVPVTSEAAPVKGFIRDCGVFDLDSTGSQLVISNAPEGRLEVAANRQRGTSATQSAPNALRDGWFVFVDSPNSIWFYDGGSHLNVLVHDDYDGFSGAGGVSAGIFDTCPAEVTAALPEAVRFAAAANSNGEPRSIYGPTPIGVGILLYRLDGGSPPRIRAVIPGSPAAQAGIQAGWQILSVDGKACADTDECWKLIHGKSGTEVILTFATLESAGDSTVKLTRRYVFPDR